MKKFLLFLLAVVAFASALALTGCLNEKKLDTTGAFAGLPTATPSPNASVVVPSATLAPSALPTVSTPTPTPTAVPSPSPSPSPTAPAIGECEINTPRGQTQFDSPASVQFFVAFTSLPDSVKTASIQCRDDDPPMELEITRSDVAGTYIKRTCNYSPASNLAYRVYVNASGTQCVKTITVNAG